MKYNRKKSSWIICILIYPFNMSKDGWEWVSIFVCFGSHKHFIVLHLLFFSDFYKQNWISNLTKVTLVPMVSYFFPLIDMQQCNMKHVFHRRCRKIMLEGILSLIKKKKKKEKKHENIIRRVLQTLESRHYI